MPTEESKPAEWIGTFERFMRMVPISEANLWTPSSFEKDELSKIIPDWDAIEDARWDLGHTAIVTKNNTPIGYVDLHTLWGDSPVAGSPEDIPLDILSEILTFKDEQFLEPTTSIYEAEQLLVQNPEAEYFVLRKGKPLALFDWERHFSGTALRTCAYAAVSNLEIAMLSLLQHCSSEAIGLLMPPYLHVAMELYDKKQLRRNPDGGYDTRLLLGCTTFKTKMHLVRQLTCIQEENAEGTWFTHKDLNKFNEIRNWLAHPEANQDGAGDVGLVLSLRIISIYEKLIQYKLGIVGSMDNLGSA